MLQSENTLWKPWSLISLFLASNLILGFLPVAYSCSGKVCAEPDIWKVTVIRVELSKDSGTTWSKTVGTKTQEFDIASVNVNTAVGNYLSGAPVLEPNTTYNAVRVTISETFKMKGEVVNGGSFYTTAAGGTSIRSGDLAEGSYTITQYNNLPSGNNSVSGGQCLDERTADLRTDGSGNLAMSVCFNVSAGLALNNSDDLEVGSPSITYTSGSC